MIRFKLQIIKLNIHNSKLYWLLRDIYPNQVKNATNEMLNMKRNS